MRRVLGRRWLRSSTRVWLPGTRKRKTGRGWPGAFLQRCNIKLQPQNIWLLSDVFVFMLARNIAATKTANETPLVVRMWSNQQLWACREAATRERLALLRSHDRAAYAQLVAQHNSSRVGDLLAQVCDVCVSCSSMSAPRECCKRGLCPGINSISFPSVLHFVQTNCCLWHLSQRLRLMNRRASDGRGNSASADDSVGSGGSGGGPTADEAEAWARRMVFDADVEAAPLGLHAELRPYQMKVRRRSFIWVPLSECCSRFFPLH